MNIQKWFLSTLLTFCLGNAHAETVDIYLRWNHPTAAKFNVYRKIEGGEWKKIATVNEKNCKILGVAIVDQIFKVSAVTEQGESPGTSTIYLVSNKLNAPGWTKLLTDGVNKTIVPPTKLKLYGLIQK